jgi:hypothetical protein
MLQLLLVVDFIQDAVTPHVDANLDAGLIAS